MHSTSAGVALSPVTSPRLEQDTFKSPRTTRRSVSTHHVIRDQGLDTARAEIDSLLSELLPDAESATAARATAEAGAQTATVHPIQPAYVNLEGSSPPKARYENIPEGLSGRVETA